MIPVLLRLKYNVHPTIAAKIAIPPNTPPTTAPMSTWLCSCSVDATLVSGDWLVGREWIAFVIDDDLSSVKNVVTTPAFDEVKGLAGMPVTNNVEVKATTGTVTDSRKVLCVAKVCSTVTTTPTLVGNESPAEMLVVNVLEGVKDSTATDASEVLTILEFMALTVHFSDE